MTVALPWVSTDDHGNNCILPRMTISLSWHDHGLHHGMAMDDRSIVMDNHGIATDDHSIASDDHYHELSWRCHGMTTNAHGRPWHTIS